VAGVSILGAAMTRFGKHLDRSARDLVEEAVAGALTAAEVEPPAVEAAFVGNAVAGLMSGQESIRGQVVLRNTGVRGVPIVNVENACASSSTALHLGWQSVAAGAYDCVLIAGFEKLYDEDRSKSLRAFNASMDLDELRERFGVDAGADRSVFMDLYAEKAPDDIDTEALALVAVKNRHHGSLNEFAQFREDTTVEGVLASRPIAGPLTLEMCSRLCDGAAAVVLGPERPGTVRIAASALVSGRGDDAAMSTAEARAAARAYELAGVGPDDLDLIELHDATAAAELELYEKLGLCSPGAAPGLVRDRVTWLGGALPVNASGGLLARGHPIGATGVAQAVELTWQLEGRCGARQVPGARVALAQNAGGYVGTDAAACAVHVLTR
jgi:acetyl-CoA acetyltransferase